MIAGYGATDFKGPICYRNGKRPGWYLNKDKEWSCTLHPESILALSLGKLLEKKTEGFKKIVSKKTMKLVSNQLKIAEGCMI